MKQEINCLASMFGPFTWLILNNNKITNINNNELYNFFHNSSFIISESVIVRTRNRKELKINQIQHPSMAACYFDAFRLDKRKTRATLNMQISWR